MITILILICISSFLFMPLILITNLFGVVNKNSLWQISLLLFIISFTGIVLFYIPTINQDAYKHFLVGENISVNSSFLQALKAPYIEGSTYTKIPVYLFFLYFFGKMGLLSVVPFLITTTGYYILIYMLIKNSTNKLFSFVGIFTLILNINFLSLVSGQRYIFSVILVLFAIYLDTLGKKTSFILINLISILIHPMMLLYIGIWVLRKQVKKNIIAVISSIVFGGVLIYFLKSKLSLLNYFWDKFTLYIYGNTFEDLVTFRIIIFNYSYLLISISLIIFISLKMKRFIANDNKLHIMYNFLKIITLVQVLMIGNQIVLERNTIFLSLYLILFLSYIAKMKYLNIDIVTIMYLLFCFIGVIYNANIGAFFTTIEIKTYIIEGWYQLLNEIPRYNYFKR